MSREPAPSLARPRWARLNETRVFFGHQSVGANILAGVSEIMAEDSTLRLSVARVDDPSSVIGPALLEAKIGENGDHRSKATAFEAALRNGMGQDGGIALFKYCYLDVHHGTDVDAMFANYVQTIETLRRTRPEITVVHVTLPLTRDESPLRRLAKTALRKPGGRDLNAKRNRYNELLRQRYAGEPLFDLARVQSTLPDGSRTSFSHDGGTAFTLAPEYTHDGGHLNEAGRRAAALELLKVLAQVAATRD
jgi:lysophospholipase L1-like esterase